MSASKHTKAEREQRRQRILALKRADGGLGQNTITKRLLAEFPDLTTDEVKGALRQAGARGELPRPEKTTPGKRNDLAASSEATAAEGFPPHPAATLLPVMGDAELRELAADIAAHKRLLDPIIIYQGQILDGRNRLAACKLAGIEPAYARLDDPSLDPIAFVLSKNLYRRHLTAEQKRGVIAAVLKADPSRSNRQVAEQVGVSDKTVGSVREEQERRAEIPHVETRTDSKGRKQAARRKPARRRRGEFPHVETEKPQASEAPAPEQQQFDLPFAGGSAHATPSPYPQATAAATSPPHELLAALHACRARLDRLLATPRADDVEGAFDLLAAIDAEQGALGQLHAERWERAVGVPVEEPA